MTLVRGEGDSDGGHMLGPPPLIYVSSGGVMCPRALIALLIWKLAHGGEYFSKNGSFVIEQKIGERMRIMAIQQVIMDFN